ncbi:MAG: phospholipase D-like domain-containing protein [Armatimonadota bacterium]
MDILRGCSLHKSDWEDTLFDMTARCAHRLTLLAPFVKYNVFERLLGVKADSVEVRLLSRFSVPQFHRGVSDIAVFRRALATDSVVRSLQRLHAKVYIFDDTHAIVTSGNLTTAGLQSNVEYGVVLSDVEMVEEIVADSKALFTADEVGIIDMETVAEVEAILEHAAPPTESQLPDVQVQTLGDRQIIESGEIFDGDIDAIRHSLTGWKASVFDVLTQIPAAEFNLEEVYEFVPDLSEQYPDNRHIHAKIRQQLQYLRKLDLVRFLGKGHYRKLWKQDYSSS